MLVLLKELIVMFELGLVVVRRLFIMIISVVSGMYVIAWELVVALVVIF